MKKSSLNPKVSEKDINSLSTEELEKRIAALKASKSLQKRPSEEEINSLSTEDLEKRIAALKGTPKEESLPEASLRHLARTGADIGAGALGAVPDLLSLIPNVAIGGANLAGAEVPYIPSATRGIREFINEKTEGYTAPQGPTERFISDALQIGASLPGGGGVGALIKGGLKAAKTTSAAEKYGMKIADFLKKGSEVNAPNVGAISGVGLGTAFGNQAAPEDPATQLLLGLGGGLTGSYAAGIGSRLLGGKGLNLPQKIAEKQALPEKVKLNPKTIEEMRALEEATGLELPPEVVTKHPYLKKVADSIINAEDINAETQLKALERLDKLENRFADQVSRLTEKKLDKAQAGNKIYDLYENTKDKLEDIRRNQAKADYKFAADMTKNLPVVKIDNYMNALDDLIEKYSNIKLVPGVKDPVKPLLDTKANILRTAHNTKGLVTVKEIGANLSALSKKMDKIKEGIGYADAAKLKSALNKDLELAAESGIEGADALKLANKNYAENSRRIKGFEESALSKIIGKDKAPEQIAEIFTKKEPSQIKEIMGTLSEHKPDLIPELQRFYFDNALESAKEAGKTKLSLHTLRKELGSDAKISALFPDEPRALEGIKDLMEYAKALEFYGATHGGSPTVERGVMSGVFGDLKTLIWERLKKAFSTSSKEKLREIFLDKDLRDLVIDNKLTSQDLKKLHATKKQMGTRIALEAAAARHKVGKNKESKA